MRINIAKNLCRAQHAAVGAPTEIDCMPANIPPFWRWFPVGSVASQSGGKPPHSTIGLGTFL